MGSNDILGGMFGVDADGVDQVIHDGFDLAAGVEESEFAVVVGGLDDLPVPGEEDFPQVGGADEGSGFMAHVVADIDRRRIRENGRGFRCIGGRRWRPFRLRP